MAYINVDISVFGTWGGWADWERGNEGAAARIVFLIFPQPMRL